jgi:hypothetical protein
VSAIKIELPEAVHQRAAQLAQRQSMSLDRLLVVALVKKLATAFPDEALEARAQRGTRQGFEEFMKGVPDAEPEDLDRLPNRVKPA